MGHYAPSEADSTTTTSSTTLVTVVTDAIDISGHASNTDETPSQNVPSTENTVSTQPEPETFEIIDQELC